MPRSWVPFLVLALCFRAPGFATAADDDELKQVQETRRHAVVYLTCVQGSNDPTPKIGTGFFFREVNNNLIVITNDHVVENATAVFATLSDGRTYPCQQVDRNDILDLAALSLPTANLMNPTILEPTDKPDDDPDLLTSVLLIGHPLGLKWTVHKGFVSQIKTLADLVQVGLRSFAKDPSQRVIQLDITSAKGYSGAPVIDRRGKVLGVESEGASDGIVGINFCIPVRYVNRLDLEKRPKDFQGGDGNGANLNLNLQGLNLNPQFTVQEPTAPDAVPGEFMRTKAWGILERNPAVIFDRFVEDKEKFKNLVLAQHLEELVNRHQIVHLTNPFFRFSILVPDCFDFREDANPNNLSMRTDLVYKGSDPNNPLSSLTIRARKIDPPSMTQLPDLFPGEVNNFRFNVLNLEVCPPGAAPMAPNHEGVVNSTQSDATARFHNLRPISRLVHIYQTWDNLEQAHFVSYAINGDMFIAVDFRFNHSEVMKNADWSSDWIERVFVAASLSFYD